MEQDPFTKNTNPGHVTQGVRRLNRLVRVRGPQRSHSAEKPHPSANNTDHPKQHIARPLFTQCHILVIIQCTFSFYFRLGLHLPLAQSRFSYFFTRYFLSVHIISLILGPSLNFFFMFSLRTKVFFSSDV